MKVYFSSTVKAKANLGNNFRTIYKTIEELGHKNVTDFIICVDPAEFYSRKSDEASKSYRDTVRRMKSADVVIYEVSFPSLGVGYMVNLALDMEKPVILLHTIEHSPFLFTFLKNDKLQIHEYTVDNLKDILSSALDVARETANVRFTFFVTPKILHFLDFVAKKRNTPRAVYLRKLIDEAVKKEKFKEKSPF